MVLKAMLLWGSLFSLYSVAVGQYPTVCDGSLARNARQELKSRLMDCGSYTTVCNTNATYNSKILPPAAGAVEIRPSMAVTRSGVSGLRSSIHVNMYFRQTWSDTRLSWDPLTWCNITSVYLTGNRVWVPDSFFSGTLDIDFFNEAYILVNNSGLVTSSKRLLIEYACADDFDFTYYPFDTQRCRTEFESYGLPASELVFERPEPSDLFNTAIDCIPECPTESGVFKMSKPHVVFPNASLSRQSAPGGSVTYGNREFSVVTYEFEFKRSKERYIITTFLPLWLIVGMSYLGMFISPNAAPARAAVAVISVLVLVSLSFGPLRSEIPVVSYTLYLDVYLLICFIATMANTCEYALINFLLTTAENIANKAELRKSLRAAAKHKYLIKKKAPELKTDEWDDVGRSFFWLDGKLRKHLIRVLHRVTHGHHCLIRSVDVSDLVELKFPSVLARAIVKYLKDGIAPFAHPDSNEPFKTDAPPTSSFGRMEEGPVSGAILSQAPGNKNLLLQPPAWTADQAHIEPHLLPNEEDKAPPPKVVVEKAAVDFAAGRWTLDGEDEDNRRLSHEPAKHHDSDSEPDDEDEITSEAQDLRYQMLKERFQLFSQNSWSDSLAPDCCLRSEPSISITDLRAVLAGMDGVSPDNVNHLLKHCDQDGNGIITLSEFQTLASTRLTRFWAHQEPTSFYFLGIPFSKARAKRFEDAYRFWAPVTFLVVTAIWLGLALSGD
eukprot:Hpha_TRINITY_DN16586_c1_g1::TRINITY_DN16586_c1_g1_i1::g.135651::m.135651/K05196/GLRB; glycine receptor beta